MLSPEDMHIKVYNTHSFQEQMVHSPEKTIQMDYKSLNKFEKRTS